MKNVPFIETVHRVAYPQAPGDALTWAPASGWGEFGAEPRRVSCVALAMNDCARLIELLPALSDVLTECGYPWEIITVDGSSTDGTGPLLSDCDQIPGFRSIHLLASAWKAMAIATGLEAARGDAIVLIEARTDHSPRLIADMMLRWEGGAKVVYAAHGRVPGDSRVASLDDGDEGDDDEAAEARAALTELVLLDRDVVRWLLR
jgi:glycosyltransferase involved in cell wall biosynthesis